MVIAAPAQKTMLTPRGFSAAHDRERERHRGRTRDLAGVPERPREDDLPDGERHDQRIQPQNPDQDPVDEADPRPEADAREDSKREPVTRHHAHADEEVPAEGDDARRREVDARVHDHEHLPERRDGENRHVRQDVRE